MDFAHPLAVVTPTLDGDVLAVLALAETTFTTGQLHRVLGQHSEDGLRRALKRLVKQGIVVDFVAGNAHLYQLNRDHLAAAAILELASLPQRFRQRLEDVLKSWDPAPVHAAVFGSAARRTMRGDSDIDLLVIRPNGADERWEDQVSALTVAATAWTGNEVRVLEYGEAEVRGLGNEEPVLSSIAAEGITVAGRPTWLRNILRRKAPDVAPH